MPAPQIHVSDFADAEFIIPKKGNKEPGPWRTSRTPYLREILDNLGPMLNVQYTRVVKGTQLGFTYAYLVLFAFIVKYCPTNVLMLMPTILSAKRLSTGKVKPVIEENPGIFKGKVRDPRDKAGGNEMYQKEFPGGELYIIGSNSAATLSSFTAKVVIRDEKDRYTPDVEGEGDPGELAENRADTYGDDAKYYDLSSPTDMNSPIWDDFLDSDRRYFNVPCPNCGIKQALLWENIVYEHEDYRLTSEVAYRCEHCRTLIAEHNKTRMLDNGEWIPTNPGHEKRGYHLSSLYSPLGWLSWKKIVKEYLLAIKTQDQAKLKKFWNTRLALRWNDEEQPLIDESKLIARREQYGPDIPIAGLILTATVDVQASPARLEVEIKAHGMDEEKWTIDYHIIDGNADKKETWQALAEYLWNTKRYHACGAPLPISLTLIDSGHASQHVYDFVREYRKHRVFCTKGSQFPGKPIFERASRSKKGTKSNKVDFFIGTDTAKDTVYSRLNVERKEIIDTETFAQLTDKPVLRYPYYMHFNESCDEEYFAQLVAERPEKVKRGRRYVRQYVQIRERNEALDLNVLHLAAIHILKPNWKRIIAKLAQQKVSPEAVRYDSKSDLQPMPIVREEYYAPPVNTQRPTRRRVISSGVSL
jgi:phage terminase large subunit GpA-like protein